MHPSRLLHFLEHAYDSARCGCELLLSSGRIFDQLAIGTPRRRSSRPAFLKPQQAGRCCKDGAVVRVDAGKQLEVLVRGFCVVCRRDFQLVSELGNNFAFDVSVHRFKLVFGLFVSLAAKLGQFLDVLRQDHPATLLSLLLQ